MAETKQKKTKDEVLAELNAAFKQRLALADKLLVNIKENRANIERKLASIGTWEPDIVYRFYHHSFKVFDGKRIVESSVKFFEEISPNDAALNSWFKTIIDEALSKEFDWDKTNPIWLEETRPILEAIWHSRYFLEQMLVAADTLETAPEILPYGWAAVLYLYDLR